MTGSGHAPSGLLSVVATPIGNLEDITLRALRTLRDARGILAEDTRRTRQLCRQHGVNVPLRSMHAHSSPDKLQRVVRELTEGAHLALVTDAGTPGVSDPGVRLVRQASEAHVRVEAIPGPSALTAALSIAGIPCDPFRFLGFLPRSGGKRRRALEVVASDEGATVLFESPHRLHKTLEEIAALVEPNREVAVCRELTKLYEEVDRGPISEVLQRYASGTKGEVTLIIAPPPRGTKRSS